ncbi:hypothetical protein QYE76_027406 [Lolium multiflorum]|uniref:Fucosyltransferase n=1 Tax=Lolium multiflorum TaxID=4521 RepID=A0AAD8QMK4_LOLMU|nr:hypothetical protein QYE76_027406 [Lolium multiflorum]
MRLPMRLARTCLPRVGTLLPTVSALHPTAPRNLRQGLPRPLLARHLCMQITQLNQTMTLKTMLLTIMMILMEILLLFLLLLIPTLMAILRLILHLNHHGLALDFKVAFANLVHILMALFGNSQYQGLGNRILAAASAFLYAMLTGRVLLVDPSNEMGQLFCEPFPGTTWLLPPDFPLTSYTNFSIDTAESYGNMLKNKVIDAASTTAQQLPPFAYVHLDHDASVEDKFFFCDEDQRVLRDIRWLVMRTDSYIVPGLFLVTGFQEELGVLFPEPDAVFHHLGRYLFHTNNNVWGFITRYYDAYLATAHQRVAIQVRVFGADPESPELLEQITTCTQKENLLPGLLAAGIDPPAVPTKFSKAVLVTSLKSWYYDRLKSMYWEHAAASGEAVGVHQPSHEKYQQFGARLHDTKAWADIYLLSLTDVLVTSGRSTFGYVAQGLGGLTPWVMYKPANGSVVPPDPPCGRDVSMEPCFHNPPFYGCRIKQGVDTGKIVPHVQRCKDVSWGLKLVPRVP